MLSTAIIIFRETIEIAMIVGVVLAATHKLPGRAWWVAGGFFGGVAGAGLVAVFAEAISNSLSGMGQEFFNAMILFTAALVIGWTAVWIRKNAHAMAMHLHRVGQDAADGKLPLYSISLIIGLALLREGSEIVLFIYGMALSGQSTHSIVTGSTIGLTLGGIVGVMLYYGLLRMPARRMLNVTSWLLMLLVAGLASQGVAYLSAAGYFTGFSHPLWDTSWLLSEDSIAGKSLHSLIGYSARPTQIQLTVYLGTLAMLLAITRRIDSHRKKHVAAAAVALLAIFTLKASPAYALDEIYTPNIVHHELALEYNGSRTFDHDPAVNNAQSHELAVELGLTDRWLLEVSGGFAKEPNQSLKMESAQIESRFQFFEQGKYWLDSGLLVAYGFATQSHAPDAIETKLLLQKDTGQFTHMANIGFEQEVGQNASDSGPDYVFLWNSRYRYSEHFQPGLEIQSDLGQGRAVGNFNRQEHYIGPSAYGEIIPHVKYQAAYLFGASDASANSAARLLLEYESHF